MKEEEFTKYLPKYLSVSSLSFMRDALKAFPDIDSSRYYTTKLAGSQIVYQGDGIKDLIIVDLPSTQTKKKDSIVISNTCDIDQSNIRPLESRILYSPLILLDDYEKILLQEGYSIKIEAHVASIKKQEITQIFFLPGVGAPIKDSIVLLDRILNLPNDSINRLNLQKDRVFTLSNFGHYLLLFKLSVHLSRIQEGLDRD